MFGSRISSALNIPRIPSQRGSEAGAQRVEQHHDHADDERQAREQREVGDDLIGRAGRERAVDRVAGEVVPDGEVVRDDRVDDLVGDAREGDGDAAAEHERPGRLPHRAGAGTRPPRNRNSRISVNAPIATAASTLPAISVKAWWEMNLTSFVRGLTAGFASPATSGASPWRGPTVGSPLRVEVMTIALSRYRKPPANAGTARRLRRLQLRGDLLAGSRPCWASSRAVYDLRMEGGSFGDLFGDPDDLQRRLAEFAEQMQGSQRLAWADNAIKLAVDMTVAAVGRVNIQGDAEAQAEQIRTVIARVFPEAVSLVREAREGLQ